MAKLSSVVRNDKIKKLNEKYRTKRLELRKKIADPSVSMTDKLEFQKKLQKLPVDSSESRYRNRCMITGRSRGFYRKFKLSRIKFRELAHQGLIPGVTKSSW